ncbi:MAG: tol-pal system-associated acyl-CoA thioesterase [Sterolibacterium sp.]|nr:tol-pal system-associated acyl-CoA thioesterase [Sterolibacterium sp.]
MISGNEAVSVPHNVFAAVSFMLPVRVYYEDTDAAGMVYYANYLRFMERARTEWLRQLGFQQSRMVEEQGVAFVARSAAVDYLKPARLDDQLTIASRVIAVGRAQVTFEQHVLRATQTLASGVIRIACVDPARGRPCAMPADLLRLFQGLVEK